MKIIAVGPKVCYKKKGFSGQAELFDGLTGYLAQKGNKVCEIDIGNLPVNPFLKKISYLIIILNYFFRYALCRYTRLYITTSESRLGFYRDYLMIGIADLFKSKIIAHYYGGSLTRLFAELNQKEMLFFHKMLEKVSTIIVEGEYMKTQFLENTNVGSKLFVVPNGLPKECGGMFEQKRFKEGDVFTVLYLSNLIFTKGYFYVLEAINDLVNKDHLNVKCIFAGSFIQTNDDPYSPNKRKKDFFNYIDKHGLSDAVSYKKGLYGDDKDFAFRTSYAFVLPSFYIDEGQPVSILEAMAYGCVPIVTPYRHIPMMINMDNGCFVDPQSSDSIRQAIKNLITSPDIYTLKSAHCIKDYKDKFTFDKFTSAIYNFMN